MKYLKSVLSISIVSFITSLTIYIYKAMKPLVSKNYQDKIVTNSPLEKKYLKDGSYKTRLFTTKTNTKNKYIYIIHPKVMKRKYPVIIINNGTNVKGSSCYNLFKHLASWGFIVVYNDCISSWNGDSSKECLQYIIKCNQDTNSIFYNHIDLNRIGTSGHSQGGVGVISSITDASYGKYYKCAFIASISEEKLSKRLGWTYDISKVSISIFMVAGTGKVDSEVISPLQPLTDMFNRITNSPLKVFARRKKQDHGEMISASSGYEVAWFRMHFYSDIRASEVFKNSQELLKNDMYQDQIIKEGN